jgi:hypothetical protein
MKRKTVLHLSLLLLFSLQSILAADPASRSCPTCSAVKSSMLCDYHVGKRHDRSYQPSCLAYARYVDIDGAHAKAAWYYLLGNRPDLALSAARHALAEGQSYAADYAWFALAIEGKAEEAVTLLKRYLPTFRAIGKGFTQDLLLMKTLYPKARFRNISHVK